jgi:hypothetical protein
VDEDCKTLKRYFGLALRRANASRPMSFYLLLAIVVVMTLGTQLVYFREDPKQFALYLSLMLLFFFVVAFRAVLDFFDIVRRHLHEQRDVYRNTLGDEDFAAELGRRVSEGRDQNLLPASDSGAKLED